MRTSLTTRTVSQSARAGFTLIEIMLVVVILGILATVVAVNLIGQTDEARIAATRHSIAAIGVAIEMWEVRTGSLPDSLDQLATGTEDGFKPLRSKKNLNDSWGNPFQYKKINKSDYEVRSAGPNGTMGDSDDLINAVD